MFSSIVLYFPLPSLSSRQFHSLRHASRCERIAKRHGAYTCLLSTVSLLASAEALERMAIMTNMGRQLSKLLAV